LTHREEEGVFSRIYWIGGEVLPYRDQVREKREQRHP
jgi:hypothetical protein